MSDTPNSCALNCDNPWLGMQSFSEAEKNFFFGREKEVDELFRMVRRERLTVFYGKSGLGKSSLLCAGLYPRLRESSMIPVPIRLDFSSGAPSPKNQVILVFQDTLRSHGVEFRPINREESLWAYFHDRGSDFWDSRNRLITPVLCFDQFEEYFTVGRRNEESISGVDLLLNELSALLENRPPASLLASFEDEYKQKNNLETEDDPSSRFDFDKTTCKVVFTLREDYLPELSSLSNRFPAILGNMLRLQCMDEPQAKEVVLRAGGHLVSGEIADEIIRFVACANETKQLDKTMEVEPVLVNVVLYELNRRRLAAKQTHIDSALLSGTRDEIIHNFYEEALRGLPKRVRQFIEEGLLTRNGRRDSCAWENAVENYDIDAHTLQTLIDRNLVRREERPSGTRVELVHERLTDVVQRQRRLRRLFSHRVRILMCAAGVMVAGLAVVAVFYYRNLGRVDDLANNFMTTVTGNVERTILERKTAAEIYLTQMTQPIVDSLSLPPRNTDVYYLMSSLRPPNTAVDPRVSPYGVDDKGHSRKLAICPDYPGFMLVRNATVTAPTNVQQLAGMSPKFRELYSSGAYKFRSLCIGFESGAWCIYPWREWFNSEYDHRDRPWYRLCKEDARSSGIISYEFSSTRTYGCSYAKALAGQGRFLGAMCVDMFTLDDLFFEFSRQLPKQSLGEKLKPERIHLAWLELNHSSTNGVIGFRIMSRLEGRTDMQVGDFLDIRTEYKDKLLSSVLSRKLTRLLQDAMLDSSRASGVMRTVFEGEDVWYCWVRTPTTNGTVGAVIALIPTKALQARRLFANLDESSMSMSFCLRKNEHQN